MLASVFVDLVPVAVAVALGAVPRQFHSCRAFTAVLWQEASSLEALAVLLSDSPSVVLVWEEEETSEARPYQFGFGLMAIFLEVLNEKSDPGYRR